MCALKLYCKLSCGICRCSAHQVGRVALVTGANSGLGLALATDLAERGARVLLACRSLTRARQAKDLILARAPHADVVCLQLDLADLTSVRRLAERVRDSEQRLDIFVNNAAAVGLGNKKTEDGLLAGMQVNYFGPFLLTCLLLPLLKRSKSSRIINVSSNFYTKGNIDMDNLNFDKPDTFNEVQVYANSKLCGILMGVELSRRLEGSNVTINSLHPGAVDSDVMRSINGQVHARVIATIMRLFYKNVWEGVQTAVYLAVSPDVQNISGKFFIDCQERHTSLVAQDAELAKRLWMESKKLVKLKEDDGVLL
ncbi:Retinol dehydrogenase 14 [Eumeta japonica]|uniref:Retinol dehydrogenase 14 n=1 Tax=Eumeta variegata TaxID=151549 RepID=A0A4C1Y7I4_EUMVA|nr:Retinol dehydrogenase 14 [Eumeta japonica]